MPAVGRITCPLCGTASDEPMPADSCLYFFECPSCHAVLRPKAGDCCVFCSYGNTACPSRQSDGC
ncbi:MAG: GDCCVxC domain-containing (seleno)protein [Gemmatimonadales bacterium]